MMYSTKEKLHHFRQLCNPLAAEADLALLHEKNPQSTDFTRFDLAPQKNAEDILFALLNVADHDDIVRNRREFFSRQNAEENEAVDNAVDNAVTDTDTDCSDEVTEQETDTDTDCSDEVTEQETDTLPPDEAPSGKPADEAQKQTAAAPKQAAEKKSRSPKKKSTPK